MRHLFISQDRGAAGQNSVSNHSGEQSSKRLTLVWRRVIRWHRDVLDNNLVREDGERMSDTKVRSGFTFAFFFDDFWLFNGFPVWTLMNFSLSEVFVTKIKQEETYIWFNIYVYHLNG